MKRQEKALKRKRRHLRVRKKIKGTPDRPRLCVYKSLKHIYAQIVIDPPIGPSKTIVSASTLSPEIRESVKNCKGKIDKAKLVGALISKKAKELNIFRVCFDRSGYKYHGRVKALAQEARNNGLEF